VGPRHLVAVVLLAAVAVAACGDDDGDATGTPNPQGRGGAATIHTVPQLEPVVRALVEANRQNSGAEIRLAVGPRDEVAYAVSQGAPAILPGAWLGGASTKCVVLGRNLAIIAVPAGNPAQVTGVGAFAPATGLRTAICGADSPFGNFAGLVLARGGVQPDSGQVASGCDADAVARVARGELDAALLFRSLVPIPAGVEVINIPDGQNLVIDVRYAPATNNRGNDSFEAFLASDPAKQVLTQHGLLP
jgi:molybdate transport system substrate-binding protein